MLSPEATPRGRGGGPLRLGDPGKGLGLGSRRRGISVWLKAELPLLLRRVLKRNNRPLLEKDPEGVMRRLMETRYPVYAKADITVESHDLPHDAIVIEIIDALAGSAVLLDQLAAVPFRYRQHERAHHGFRHDAAHTLRLDGCHRRGVRRVHDQRSDPWCVQSGDANHRGFGAELGRLVRR